MKNILLICGGMSAEHEISIISLKNIKRAIDKSKYNMVIVVISKSGIWYNIDDEYLDNITKLDYHISDESVSSLIRKTDGVYLFNNNESILIDCVFPILHGPNGEDGSIQGMFEIMNIAYVGPGVAASMIAMDKDLFKKIISKDNILSANSITMNIESNISYNDAKSVLKSDILFIKPAIMGSSIGISKIYNQDQYDSSIKNAYKYCDKIIIEEFIDGRELECAIIGNDDPIASVIGEIKPSHDFYSYEAKYIDPNGAELIIPANIPIEIEEKMKKIAIDAYKLIACVGMARIDFILSGDDIYLNEMNTIPGFTEISMYPKLFEYSGIKYNDLISKLIELAIESNLRKAEYII